MFVGIPEVLAATPIKPFIGGFRHVVRQGAQGPRPPIDDATATMSAFVRGIARDMLRDANGIPAKSPASSKKAKPLTVTADEKPFTAPPTAAP
jgi:hypothetical protein